LVGTSPDSVEEDPVVAVPVVSEPLLGSTIADSDALLLDSPEQADSPTSTALISAELVSAVVKNFEQKTIVITRS